MNYRTLYVAVAQVGVDKSNRALPASSANHIITECPLNRPPNGLHSLSDVDADAATLEWLPINFPKIWLFLLVI